MLVVGDVAPEFAARAQDGTTVRLSELRGNPVILYFYPRASSAGCTRESMEFARLYGEFQSNRVRVLGISVDDVDRQREFAEECHLPFPLLADPSKEIARSYGALGVLGLAKRVTFLIDGTGRIVEVIDSLLPRAHAERARQHWGPPGRPSPPR